jgi:predicted DNA-binding protein YlxM (UPF0122 family)
MKNEIEKLVMRQCEFLSFYLEDYEAKLSLDPNNEELRELVKQLREEWTQYDKIYTYIKKTLSK